MATFDNPSYFTISGSTSPQVDQLSNKSNSKRFKSWFRLKRPFRAKNAVDENRNPSSPESNPVAEQPHEQPTATRNSTSSANDFAKNDVVYYNFTSATSEPAVDEDDVFSDTSTIRENVGSTIGSTRTLNRRRHSLGAWFRSSLAVVRKTASSAASTASGLESAAAVERPSTSSEHQLLPRAVSTSTNCVSYRSHKDVRTCESSRLAASSTWSNANGSSSANNVGRKSRSKLPVAVKSHVELRARARFARQEKLFGEAKAVASTSRIPRPVKSPHTTASLDRRYTNSTEVLASASSKSEDNPLASSAASSAGVFQMETDGPRRGGSADREENRPEGEDLFQADESRTRNRARTQLHRSRTVEERSRSCCSRVNISSRSERRRASLDVGNHSSHSTVRRRCQRCREKVELSPSERFDVVIIYSRNCTIASPWIAYLSNVIQSLFRSKDRPPTSVTSRDVESIVNCNSFGGGTFERGGSSYANQSTVEQVDNERWKCRHVYRKTVASALLQIVLVSRPLLQHIGANANDPLGKLLHPMRVIGLMLGVDESTDINELHMSALYTFKYWPRITMADQDLASIDRFIRLSSSILQQSQPALLPKVARFKITPKKLRPGENKVTLLLFETADDIRHQAEILVGSEEVSGEPIRISRMTWVNPYCASFHVPDKFLERDIIVKVELNIGGLSWGSRDLKCQNKLGELSILLQKNHLIGNPLDLMCQAMKISPLDHKRLDEELAKNLVAQRVPGHLFQMSKADEASETARGEEFPTVLHFAARFGFVELMWLLLECPGATEALKIPNADGHDVVALANLHGHTEIVSNLQSMQEVDDLYIEMERNASENEYCVMHYDQLPPPRPVTPSEEQAQKGAIIESNYLPLVPDESIDECAGESAMEPTGDLTEDVEIRGSPEALPLTSKKKIQPKSCMDELVYMMNMFKDGKINIRQLEIFFEQWKSRKDVVNDVTEKKAVLESMKVILQKQKVEEKKNTAWVLNRMKSVLRLRSAKDDAASEGSGSVVPPIPILPARNIKVSGRSPQSSWSSDRSSAASRLSHDSGTHSDSTEEKKASQANPTAHEYDTPPPTDGALKASSDYAIPPHPRLVTEPAGSPNLPPRKLSAGSTGGGSRTIFPLPRPPPKQEYLEEIFISQPSENKATSGHPKGLAIMPLFEETDLLVQMPIRPPPPPSSSPPPSPPLKPLVLANYAGTSRALDVQHPYERESSAESFYMDMSSGLHSPKRSGSPRNDMNTIQHRYPYQDEDYVTSEEINVPGAFASSNSLVERVRPQVEPQVKQGLGMSRHKSSSLSALSPEISSPNPPQLPPPRKMSVCPKPKPMPRNRSPVLPPKRD